MVSIYEDSLLSERQELAIKLGWLEIEKEFVLQISQNDRSTAQKHISAYAKQTYCRERSAELKSQVKLRCKLPQKNLITCLMVMFGGLSMTGVGTIMGQRWGIFTIPGTFAFGAVTTLCSDDRAKKAIASCQLYHNSKNALTSVQTQAKESANYSFKQHLYLAKANQHQSIEKQALNPDLTRDLCLSGFIFGGESAISLALLSLAGFPGGFPLALLASLLPLGVNCIGAAVQADWYEYPEMCQQLAELYEDEIKQN